MGVQSFVNMVRALGAELLKPMSGDCNTAGVQKDTDTSAPTRQVEGRAWVARLQDRAESAS